MKVVHINTQDSGGGAAIAAFRHCEAMKRNGIDSLLLVHRKHKFSDLVRDVKPGSFISRLAKKIISPYFNRIKRKAQPMGTFSIMYEGEALAENCIIKTADIIILHWVNSNFLSISEIEEILKLGKPTIWYMHDMWPITGGCHHSMGCDKYKTSCDECHLITNHDYDFITRKQLRHKIKHWSHYNNLVAVAPSNWLAGCIRESALLKNHNVYVVPNPIDTTVFKPLGFETKSLFGLNPLKKTILFMNADNSIYKGWKYMKECLEMLDPDKYEGLVIGNMNDSITREIPINVVTTGFLSDNLSLTLAYNACDTFVMSSIAENYPNVILEALSCGKPCIGFPTGGIPDLIIDHENGFITHTYSSTELVQAIENLFADELRYKRFSTQARRSALKNDYSNILEMHSEIDWNKYIVEK